MIEKFKFVIAVIVVAVVVGFVLFVMICSIGSCATLPDYMTKKEEYRDGYTAVDERTGVMYFMGRGMIGMTVLLNEDGTPMLWKE